MYAVAWHIPGLTHDAVGMRKPETEASTPTDMKRTVDLSIEPKEHFAPMLTTTLATNVVVDIPLPHGIDKPRTRDIHIIARESVADSHKDAVARMLLVHDIDIGTHTEIGSTGVIIDARHTVVIMVGTTNAQLDNREILVMKIHPERSLVLSIAAQRLM